MAFIGQKLEGFVPPSKTFYVEEVPITCLDGCRCSGAEHKIINVCNCTTGYRCAHHGIEAILSKNYIEAAKEKEP